MKPALQRNWWQLILGWLLLLGAPPGPARAQPALAARIRRFVPSVPTRSPADSLFLALKGQYSRAVAAHDEAAAAGFQQQMGQVCYRAGHYPPAFDYLRKAADAFRQLGRPNELAATCNDLGALYYANRQPGAARQQFRQALALYHRTANVAGLAETDGNLGHLCEKRGHYDSAFFYQRRALRQYRGLGASRGQAKICENLGSIFEDLARYDSARFYFRQALDFNQRANDKLGQIEVLNNLGDVQRKTGQYLASLAATRQALALARRTGEHHQVGSAYSDLAKTFNLLGQNDSAYFCATICRKNQIAIYSAANSEQLALLQTLYNLERKDQEIARLSTARSLSQLRLLGGAGVAVLLLLLGAVVISRQRLKIRTAQALAAQNQRVHEAQRELLQVELQNQRLQEESLQQALATKDRELTANTLHVIQKNQLLSDLRGRLDELVKEERRDQKKQLRQLLHQIGQNFNHDQHWEEFRTSFEQVHEPFFQQLRQHCGTLTAGEHRLAALLKLNLASPDIATSLGVSLDSLRVMRYRLRKRLNLGPGESLTAFLHSL